MLILMMAKLNWPNLKNEIISEFINNSIPIIMLNKNLIIEKNKNRHREGRKKVRKERREKCK